MDDDEIDGAKVIACIVTLIVWIISFKAYLAGDITKAFYLLLLTIAWK